MRNGKAEILADRCIDCGACASGCPYHAFNVKTDTLESLAKYVYNIVLPAPSLYSQFPANVPLEDIWQGLHNLGFDEIFDVSLASEYIAKEIEKLGGKNSASGKELKTIIKDTNKSAKQMARRLMSAYGIALRMKRPAVPFLVTGAGVGFLAGFMRNFIKDEV